MRITLTITNAETQADDQDLLSLDVYPEMTIETLRSSIQVETGHPSTSQHLYHNGKLINDNSKTLAELNVDDGDMMALHVRDIRGSTGIPTGQGEAGPSRQQAQAPSGAQDPETVRLQILGNPALRREVENSSPQWAGALDDPVRFAQIFNSQYDVERRERAERHRMIARLNEDPFDVEAQRKIEEMIRQERVMENLQNAIEHNPEVFGYVHMLYLDVEVNGHKVKALVDSGAQATIMSPSCAEACGIMRLVDRRFAGIAKGVGTANILGRVHSAQIKIGPLFLPCSFTVMEGKTVELLLGLDMLKRYQACIDLAKNALVIQGEVVPFLGEADIPRDVEEQVQKEPTAPGPAGTTIGQRTGAVTAPGAPAPGSPVPQAEAPPAAPAAAPVQPSRPQPQQQQPPPQQQQQQQQQTSRFPREHIEQLKALGASEQQAIQALEATGGNVEYAASLIFEA